MDGFDKNGIRFKVAVQIIEFKVNEIFISYSQ